MVEVEAPVVEKAEKLVIMNHKQVEPTEVVLVIPEAMVLIKVVLEQVLQIMLQDEEVKLAVLVVDMI